MSNLGPYQDFTTAAKQAGGVEPFLAAMERAAFLRGVGATLVVVGGVVTIAGVVQRRRELHKRKHEEKEA